MPAPAATPLTAATIGFSIVEHREHERVVALDDRPAEVGLARGARASDSAIVERLARAKAFARAGEDDRAHAVVALELARACVQRAQQRRRSARCTPAAGRG